MRQLDVAFTLLREHPEIAPVYMGPYRRMLIRNFPYGIFYQAQPKRLVVAAILDLRQNPTSLRRRLFGSEPEKPPESNR
jgi:plasmid stabilization system protein ParE